jgi:SAM-dependent methyltransferase
MSKVELFKEELSKEERARNHSNQYADDFEAKQDPMRVGRLLPYLNIPKGAIIGDFGCGNSLLLEFLTERISDIKTYYGVDFSADLIAYAKKRCQRLGFNQAQYFEGAIQDFCGQHGDELDLAVAFDVSEHIYDAEWVDILRATYGALKKGGSLYLHTPNGHFFMEIMKEHNLIFKQLPEHIAVRDEDWNVALLKEAGFSQIKVHYLPHYNVLKHAHPLSHLPGLGKFFVGRLFIVATKV